MGKHSKKKLSASHGRHAAEAQSRDVPSAETETETETKSVSDFSDQASTDVVDGDTSSTASLESLQPAQTSSKQPDISQSIPPFDPESSSADGFAPVPLRRKRKVLKVFGITLATVLGLILIAYLAGCVFFMGRFFPQTTMGSYDVSLMTSSEAEKVLAEGLDDYRLKVEGEGLSFTMTPKDAGITLDTGTILGSALDDIKPWLWPFELRASHDESDKLAASYNDSGLGEFVRAKVEAFNADAVQPINAVVTYGETTSTFAVKPEVLGTALDAEAVLKVVDEVIVVLGDNAKITKNELLKPPILADSYDLKVARDAANTMIAADMQLMMVGSKAAVVGPDLVSTWVKFAENGTVALDDEALTAWVDTLAADCSTLGSSRTYTRPDGKVITVSGGSYGWSVDRDTLLTLVKDGVTAGQKGEVEVPTTQTAALYTAAGSPDWGARYVDIDLSEQHARMYDANGALIWESAIITGKPNGSYDTPSGVFMLNSKASPSMLTGYENGKKIYETPVQYWMPFVGNAIGFHDATWQAGFGGTLYRDGAGSHGCVNLPYSAAQSLYSIITPGDPVISHW